MQTTNRWVRYITILLFCCLLLVITGCQNGARHSIELTESTDHTEGDDGGKIKYKIIWGSTKHND